MLEPLPCRHRPEIVMAGFLSFANWLAHARMPLQEVRSANAQPEPQMLPPYEQSFGAPVRFNAPQNCARFPSAILDLPAPNADVSLFPALERHAEQLLAARERESHQAAILNTVRRQIVALLAHGNARLAEVAAGLDCTPRTLQRKLAEAGTHYQAVLDATRRELAEQYLREPGLTMSEVAFLLGYREQSSFNHAFRDRYGTTPAACAIKH
ncbi:AraC family transcriptional regulator [Niveibacterium sp. 24ML]|uniref:helix-turn-helix transcriptional regulator n=1 Tax=Niveibacterium sp. 24ML TaxID=2985512 RepID=UPI00226D7537|nr:AraC family transcriptional regulator [Niveibacterium sp. 24ML]MCX9158208.1 AraC family transcriptional regulator [Niveibacterium sp. 24ML]